jgi:RNA polymerase sigma-70 factor, ECF subfamily
MAGSSGRLGAGSASRPGAGSASRPGAGSASRPGAGSASRPGAGGNGRPGAGPPDLGPALERAREGDEQAFRLLYRDTHPRILRYLCALVGADAEDVASETWLQVARDLESFHGDGAGFRAWVATIARHRATDHLRRARRRPRQVTLTAQAQESWAATDDTAEAALELLATGTAIELISQLPRDQAEAVLLRVVIGLDAATAGRVLGKRPGAVRTASHRGLRRLSGWLSATSDAAVTRTREPALKRSR